MTKSSRVVGRTSVRIPARVLEAPHHPEYVGLPKGASKAKVFERLLEVGWNAVVQRHAAEAELAVYAAYEADAERQRAAEAIQRMTLRSGVV